MNILILVDDYRPSTKAAAQLMRDLALEIRRRGHAVAVAVPSATVPFPCAIAEEEGVEVLRVRTGRIKGAPLLVRGWNELRLSSVMWRGGRAYFRSKRFDLVVFYSPTIFFGGLVRRLKRLYDCPAFLVLRDLFPQWALDAGVLRKGPAYWYFKLKERLQYEAADRINVQSPANLRYFESCGLVDRSRLEVLYNWVTPSIARPAPVPDFRARYGMGGRVVFLYGGNIGVAQDMDNLVRLAEGLRQEPAAAVLLVGEGSEAGRIRAFIRDRGLTNIQIEDAVPQEQYLSLVSQFDVGLLSLNRKLTTHNYPGKLLSYLDCELPILASVNPGNDLIDLLKESGAGFVTVNGDDGTFLDNALRLARDANLRREMGRKGRALLESHFSVRKAADQILRHARRETIPE